MRNSLVDNIFWNIDKSQLFSTLKGRPRNTIVSCFKIFLYEECIEFIL